jgi:hypothetical protein
MAVRYGGALVLALVAAAFFTGCICSSSLLDEDVQSLSGIADMPSETVPGADAPDAVPVHVAQPQHVSPYPVIVPRGEPSVMNRSYSFKYRRTEHSITIAVDRTVYEGAATVDERPYGGAWQDNTTLATYYLEMTNDAAQEDMYRTILDQLDSIRDAENLTSDEYIELISCFVQQIPFDNHAPSHPRYPVEVVGEGKGDCDEKSMLLAGLLSREGYDSALLLFLDEYHATVGIAGSLPAGEPVATFSENNHTYVCIETTYPKFVGLSAESLIGADPVVVTVGTGSGMYQETEDIAYIVGSIDRIKALMADVKEQIAGADQGSERLGSFAGQHDSLVQQYNQLASVDNDAILRQYDREGVEALIRQSAVLS